MRSSRQWNRCLKTTSWDCLKPVCVKWMSHRGNFFTGSIVGLDDLNRSLSALPFINLFFQILCLPCQAHVAAPQSILWGVDNQGCEFWHWDSSGSSSINPQLPLEHPVGLSLITCPAVVIKQWPRTKPLCWASLDPGLIQSIPQSQGWG